MSLLGAFIKALDADLTLCAFVTAVVFGTALALGWEEADGRERRYLWADIGLYSVIWLMTGGISWALYFEGADPLVSIVPLPVRLIYLIGGPVFFTLHVANVLRPRLPWWRSFLCVLTWNILLVGTLMAADIWGPL